MAGPAPAVLEAAVPILAVRDLAEALDYYQRVLGFRMGWTWGEPVRLASLCRDRVEVNLAQAAEPLTVSKVYVHMTGADGYYEQVRTAGARVAVPLADRVYGMRDFRVVDPSDNELSFGEAR